MTFSQLLQHLEIRECSPVLAEIFTGLEEGAKPLFSRELLAHLQEDYNLFGEYYDAVLAGYEDLMKKPEECLWATVASRYLALCTQQEAKELPLLVQDGAPSRDVLPLLLLATRVDGAVESYQSRGFSRQEAIGFMGIFSSDIGIYVRRTGRVGLDRTYYNWITLIVYTLLFPCGSLKFNFSRNGKSAFLFRNRKDGSLQVMLHDRTLHASGNILGAAGFQEEEGSFCATVTETEEGWHGLRIGEDALVRPEALFLSKKDWELVLKPEEEVLAVHIPRGADLSPETVERSIREAFVFAEKHYPEYRPKALRCVSWLLNPKLAQFAGEESKIARFGKQFCRYPIRGDGASVYNFVFQVGSKTPLQDLPEDTRLQKAVKEDLCQGNFFLNYGGFLLPKRI